MNRRRLTAGSMGVALMVMIVAVLAQTLLLQNLVLQSPDPDLAHTLLSLSQLVVLVTIIGQVTLVGAWTFYMRIALKTDRYVADVRERQHRAELDVFHRLETEYPTQPQRVPTRAYHPSPRPRRQAAHDKS